MKGPIVIFALLCFLLGFANGNVVLLGSNFSIAFDDLDANFTPAIKGSGESGILYIAEPLDACTPLVNTVVEGSTSRFSLIIRGGCSFDDKVRNAQRAGYKAAIIYNGEDEAPLISMAGNPEGIKIHAVFVSKSSGSVLKKYAGRTDLELWIIPNLNNSSGSIVAVSSILLLAMGAAFSTCYFVQKHHIRRVTPSASQVQEFHGMSRRLVKAIPSLIFTRALEDNCTSRTCAICLEDYNRGEKLRVLPCHHKFHAICVDSWLTSWRTFCPICKRDARTLLTGVPPASESTPLLTSGPSSPASTLGFLSHHSSFTSSPPVPIMISTPTRSHHSLSGASHIVPSYKSYNNSLIISSSLVSQNSYLASPNSYSISIPSPYVSGQHSYLRHCESGASISALASA